MSSGQKNKKPKKPISPEERERRRQQRLRDLEPLLFSREQVAHLLNCSVATVQRLEKKHLLDPIKLDKECPTGKTHYQRDQVHALASGEGRS